MTKIRVIFLTIMLLGSITMAVLAQKSTSTMSNPVFYGEWHGSIWMYWDGPVNSNQPAYAHYQNLDNGKTGTLELSYYSHDSNNGITWWKSSGIVCGNIDYYQVQYVFYQVTNIPLVVDRTCSFTPFIRK
jgi:hypothetical protein